MIKVLVADDEDKVCKLIIALVDWEALGMKVVAVAHNGIEALSFIESYQPDIVITDMRMPGYDGLEMIKRAKEQRPEVEFVIISGYRHFEYAQSALKYGVRDYLLKPIKKTELEETLRELKEAYLQRKKQITSEARMRIELKQGIQKIRNGFFSEYLFKLTGDALKRTVAELNENYHFAFQNGLYQVVIIRLDGNGYISKDSMPFLEEKVLNTTRGLLSHECYEMECYVENGFVYVILNFAETQKKPIRKLFKVLLDEIILQESIFEHLRVTIGIGEITMDLAGLRRSLEGARWACSQRLILGTERLIEGERRTFAGLVQMPLFQEINSHLEESFERMDVMNVRNNLNFLKMELIKIKELSGHEMIQMTKEICNLYLFSLRKNSLLTVGMDDFLETFIIRADDCSTVDKLFLCLSGMLVTSMSEIMEKLKQEDVKPIRLTKKYIQDHYNQPLTLEIVSSVAGFNPTYFSTIFKKETGSTFLEYLTKTRMDNAKRLLKTTNDSVASICEQVGYSDVKSFTKSFARYTGLKPNQFRKLYS